jgi:hypothetical protein
VAAAAESAFVAAAPADAVVPVVQAAGGAAEVADLLLAVLAEVGCLPTPDHGLLVQLSAASVNDRYLCAVRSHCFGRTSVLIEG